METQIEINFTIPSVDLPLVLPRVTVTPVLVVQLDLILA